MSNTILRDISDLLIKTLKKSYHKQLQQIEAVNKNEELRRAVNLKASLTPYLESILHRNMYFQDCKQINISSCVYSPQDNNWRISVETILSTEHNLENPRVVVSLNDVTDTYFAELKLNMQNDYQHLQLMSQVPNSNPLHIHSAQMHMLQKYAILSHSIRFVAIKSIANKSEQIVRLALLLW